MPGPEDKGQALRWVLEKIAAARKPMFLAPVIQTPEQKKTELTAKKASELDLWHKWDQGGRKPKDLDPILKSFAPVIQKRVSTFRRAEVPTSAVEAEHRKYFVKAMQTWDPKKGGSLLTWVTWNLKHAGRFVDTNKNFASIPENISQHIGSYNSVKATLSEKLGHEPDVHSIHDYILETNHPKLGKLSLKDIKRLEKEQRRGLIQTSFDVEELGGSPHMGSRAEEVKLLISAELTPEERVVHEYSFGINGKPQLKPGEIAKKLKMDNSKVSKLRRSILDKMKKYVGDDNG